MMIPTRFPKLLAILLLPACVVWNTVDASARRSSVADIGPAGHDVEWPVQWRGEPLRPLALTEVERRFAAGFPGRMARLTNDREVLIWRHVLRPTRMLHPAADCYRALGWRIRGERVVERIENRGRSERWRCFVAERTGDAQRLSVCERIEDAAGQGFTDTSNWYWAAITGQSAGPWQAVTVASPM